MILFHPTRTPIQNFQCATPTLFILKSKWNAGQTKERLTTNLLMDGVTENLVKISIFGSYRFLGSAIDV